MIDVVLNGKQVAYVERNHVRKIKLCTQLARLKTVSLTSCRMDTYFMKNVLDFRKLLHGAFLVLPPNIGHVVIG